MDLSSERAETRGPQSASVPPAPGMELDPSMNEGADNRKLNLEAHFLPGSFSSHFLIVKIDPMHRV